MARCGTPYNLRSIVREARHYHNDSVKTSPIIPNKMKIENADASSSLSFSRDPNITERIPPEQANQRFLLAMGNASTNTSAPLALQVNALPPRDGSALLNDLDTGATPLVLGPTENVFSLDLSSGHNTSLGSEGQSFLFAQNTPGANNNEFDWSAVDAQTQRHIKIILGGDDAQLPLTEQEKRAVLSSREALPAMLEQRLAIRVEVTDVPLELAARLARLNTLLADMRPANREAFNTAARQLYQGMDDFGAQWQPNTAVDYQEFSPAQLLNTQIEMENGVTISAARYMERRVPSNHHQSFLAVISELLGGEHRGPIPQNALSVRMLNAELQLENDLLVSIVRFLRDVDPSEHQAYLTEITAQIGDQRSGFIPLDLSSIPGERNAMVTGIQFQAADEQSSSEPIIHQELSQQQILDTRVEMDSGITMSVGRYLVRRVPINQYQAFLEVIRELLEAGHRGPIPDAWLVPATPITAPSHQQTSAALDTLFSGEASGGLTATQLLKSWLQSGDSLSMSFESFLRNVDPSDREAYLTAITTQIGDRRNGFVPLDLSSLPGEQNALITGIHLLEAGDPQSNNPNVDQELVQELERFLDARGGVTTNDLSIEITPGVSLSAEMYLRHNVHPDQRRDFLRRIDEYIKEGNTGHIPRDVLTVARDTQATGQTDSAGGEFNWDTLSPKNRFAIKAILRGAGATDRGNLTDEEKGALLDARDAMPAIIEDLLHIRVTSKDIPMTLAARLAALAATEQTAGNSVNNQLPKDLGQLRKYLLRFPKNYQIALLNQLGIDRQMLLNSHLISTEGNTSVPFKHVLEHAGSSSAALAERRIYEIEFARTALERLRSNTPISLDFSLIPGHEHFLPYDDFVIGATTSPSHTHMPLNPNAAETGPITALEHGKDGSSRPAGRPIQSDPAIETGTIPGEGPLQVSSLHNNSLFLFSDDWRLENQSAPTPAPLTAHGKQPNEPTIAPSINPSQSAQQTGITETPLPLFTNSSVRPPGGQPSTQQTGTQALSLSGAQGSAIPQSPSSQNVSGNRSAQHVGEPDILQPARDTASRFTYIPRDLLTAFHQANGLLRDDIGRILNEQLASSNLRLESASRGIRFVPIHNRGSNNTTFVNPAGERFPLHVRLNQLLDHGVVQQLPNGRFHVTAPSEGAATRYIRMVMDPVKFEQYFPHPAMQHVHRAMHYGMALGVSSHAAILAYQLLAAGNADTPETYANHMNAIGELSVTAAGGVAGGLLTQQAVRSGLTLARAAGARINPYLGGALILGGAVTGSATAAHASREDYNRLLEARVLQSNETFHKTYFGDGVRPLFANIDRARNDAVEILAELAASGQDLATSAAGQLNFQQREVLLDKSDPRSRPLIDILALDKPEVLHTLLSERTTDIIDAYGYHPLDWIRELRETRDGLIRDNRLPAAAVYQDYLLKLVEESGQGETLLDPIQQEYEALRTDQRQSQIGDAHQAYAQWGQTYASLETLYNEGSYVQQQALDSLINDYYLPLQSAESWNQPALLMGYLEKVDKLKEQRLIDQDTLSTLLELVVNDNAANTTWLIAANGAEEHDRALPPSLDDALSLRAFADPDVRPSLNIPASDIEAWLDEVTNPVFTATPELTRQTMYGLALMQPDQRASFEPDYWVSYLLNDISLLHEKFGPDRLQAALTGLLEGAYELGGRTQEFALGKFYWLHEHRQDPFTNQIYTDYRQALKKVDAEAVAGLDNHEQLKELSDLFDESWTFDELKVQFRDRFAEGSLDPASLIYLQDALQYIAKAGPVGLGAFIEAVEVHAPASTATLAQRLLNLAENSSEIAQSYRAYARERVRHAVQSGTHANILFEVRPVLADLLRRDPDLSSEFAELASDRLISPLMPDANGPSLRELPGTVTDIAIGNRIPGVESDQEASVWDYLKNQGIDMSPFQIGQPRRNNTLMRIGYLHQQAQSSPNSFEHLLRTHYNVQAVMEEDLMLILDRAEQQDVAFFNRLSRLQEAIPALVGIVKHLNTQTGGAWSANLNQLQQDLERMTEQNQGTRWFGADLSEDAKRQIDQALLRF